MSVTPRILVLGIGNYLMGDEGVGVHLAEYLQQQQLLPEGVDVIDGGTGGFHLLEFFEQYDVVILIDAAMDNYDIGTIRVIRPKFAADFPRAMSTHDIGMRDLINALQILGKMPDVWLVVISIESLQQQGIEMTSTIRERIPALANTVQQLVATAMEPASPAMAVSGA